MPVDASAAVTLHSAWRGFVASMLGALLLAALGLGSWLSRGAHPINVAIALFGVGGALVILFDYPIATRFDRSGVHRRSVLREHTLNWDVIDRFTRSTPLVRPGRRGTGARGTLVRFKPGGLVAAVGRRRYLLVNRSESVSEYVALRRVVTAVSEALSETLTSPLPETAPTWVGRRKRWERPLDGG